MSRRVQFDLETMDDEPFCGHANTVLSPSLFSLFIISSFPFFFVLRCDKDRGVGYTKNVRGHGKYVIITCIQNSLMDTRRQTILPV